MNIIKPSSNVLSLSTTQNNFSNAVLIYLSTGAAAVQVNVYSNSTTQYASFVVPANQYVFLQKTSTDLVTANIAINATPAAYRG